MSQRKRPNVTDRKAEQVEEAIRRSSSIGELERLAGVEQHHDARYAFWHDYSHLPGGASLDAGIVRTKAAHSPAEAAMTACSWCGEPELLEIGEIWGHDFTIHTCCETRHEEIVTEMADDPQWATELLRHLEAEELTAFRLRRLYDEACSPPVLDFKLQVEPVTFAAMRAFVGEHHAHCAPPVCWRYGAAIYKGSPHRLLKIARLAESHSTRWLRFDRSRHLAVLQLDDSNGG